MGTYYKDYINECVPMNVNTGIIYRTAVSLILVYNSNTPVLHLRVLYKNLYRCT